MSGLHFNYVRKEAAPNGGAAKSRLHLYHYQGDVNKDPFAVAAKKIEGKNNPRLNCIQKMFYVLIEVKEGNGQGWYMVNIRSTIKRAKVTKDELKKPSPQARAFLLSENVGKLIGNSRSSNQNPVNPPPQPNTIPSLATTRIDENKTTSKKQENKTPSPTTSYVLVQTPTTEQTVTPKETTPAAPTDSLDAIQEYFNPQEWDIIKKAVVQVEKSKEEMAKGVENLKNKNDIESLTNLGLLYEGLSKTKEASEAFTKVLQECPFYLEAIIDNWETQAQIFEELVNSKQKTILAQPNAERSKAMQRLVPAKIEMGYRITSIRGTLNNTKSLLFMQPASSTPAKLGFESLKGRFNDKEWTKLSNIVAVVFNSPKEIDRSIRDMDAQLSGSVLLPFLEVEKLQRKKGRAFLQLEACEDKARECFSKVSRKTLDDYLALVLQQTTKLEKLADELQAGEDHVAFHIISAAYRKWARLYNKMAALSS
jgi:tetratricopeptide (TPR) repeat protein